ncbi:MAG: HEAT repeat domain-containing protein [Anaerolineaceae bacterium]
MVQTGSIHDVIKSLMDQEKPFPAQLLYQLSDLGPEDCHALREAWNNVPLFRRRALLEDLIELSENDDLMMFEEVGKIAINDSDPQVLISAIDLLFQAEDSHLIPIFLNLLAHSNHAEDVRAAAANALGPYIYLGEVEELHPKTLRAIEDALLKANAEDTSDLVRRRALESLGFSSREEIPALLRAASARSETAWLESAMFAMGKSADEQWQDLVLEHLDDEDLGVRIQAVHASGELSLVKARQYLIKLLDQELTNDDLRHEAIWALSQIGGEDVEDAFQRLMEQTDDEDELQWLEEALDELNFTNEKALFDMLDVEFEDKLFPSGHAHHHEPGDEDEVENAYPDETKGYDPEEWQRYIDDDDVELTDEDSYYFDEDEDEPGEDQEY